LKEVREKEIRPEAPVQAKTQVEMQPRVAASESVAQTQKMTQAEIAEIVRKVDQMVSNVRLESNRTGDKQMSLTVSDGRLKGVEIKVNIDKSGKINAEFKAENVDARNLLSDNVRELEKSLSAKGLEVNKLEIGSDAAGRRNFASQHEQQKKHEAAQEQLDRMEADGVFGKGGARDPRMGGAKPAGGPRPAAVPGAMPSNAPVIPGADSSTYVV
jgi:flagellar hook-length control protein FliK